MYRPWVITVSKAELNETSNKLNYWKGDYNSIRNRLAEIDWITEFAAYNNVEDKWIYFKDKVINLINEYVPRKRTFQSKKKNEWIS